MEEDTATTGDAITGDESYFSNLDFFIMSLMAGMAVYWFFFKNKQKEQPTFKKLTVAPLTRSASYDPSFINKMKNSGRNVVVFYGSQTGTGEEFAGRLAKDCAGYGMKGMVADPEECEMEDLSRLADIDNGLAIFCMATYGEGDPTDNAQEMYEWLQNGDVDLSGIKFAVFGLGNKTYEHYNAMGIYVDKRLEELGAERVFEVGLGDDDGNIEEDFVTWREKFWPAVCETFGVEATGDQVNIRQYTLTTHDDLPPEKMFKGEIARLRSFENQRPPYDAKNPYLAPVSVNRELHKGGDRSCMHIEFDISGSKIRYEAGDHVAVYPRNDLKLVEAIGKRLNVDLDTVVTLTNVDEEASKKHPFPNPCSYRTALLHYLDIQSCPRGHILRELAEYATEEKDKEFLLKLTSPTPEGKKYVWVKQLAGVPKDVMWPAKVISTSDDFVDLYIKSDNAELRVKKQNTCTFNIDGLPSLRHRFQCILGQKKRKAAAMAFEEDIQWVLDQIILVEKLNISAFEKLFKLNKNMEFVEFSLPLDIMEQSHCERGLVDKTDGENEGKSAGVVNETDDDDGVRVGVVNETDDGVSVGVVNETDDDARVRVGVVNETDDDENEGDSSGMVNETDDGENEGDSAGMVNETDDDENEGDSTGMVNETDDDENEGDSAGMVNETDDDDDGVSVGVVNETDENEGDSAGMVNETDDENEGDSAGMVNGTDDDENEGDSAGMVNETDDSENEGDSAGMVNGTDDDENEGNSSGMVNETDDDENEGDSAGMVNETDDDENEGDSAGMVNETDDDDGVSVGVVNETDENEGDSAGMVNETDDDENEGNSAGMVNETDDGENEGDSAGMVNETDDDENEGNSSGMVNETDDDDGNSVGLVNKIDEDNDYSEGDHDDDVQDPDYEPSEEEDGQPKTENKPQVVSDSEEEDGQPKTENEPQVVSDSEEENGQPNTENNSIPSFVKFIRKEMIVTSNDESNSKPHQRKLSECDKICDKKYTDIYIKQYKKSLEGKNGNEKKDTRPYDTVHACVFCRKLFTHIQDHFEKIHGDQLKVIEIVRLKKKQKTEEDKSQYKKQIKKLQDCLRFEGDHFHNLNVRESKEGELLIQRKSSSCHEESFNLEKYGPCPECLQWIKLGCIKVHQKNCPKSVNHNNFAKKDLIWQAKHLIGAGHTSDLLRKEVFSKMNSDDIGTCAQTDDLICKLGEVWLSKTYSHTLRRGRDSSFHMRLAGRLLKECRKRLRQPALDMMELLTVQKFDVIVEATLWLCGRNEHDELKHPSTANKIGFDVARKVTLKYGICLRNKDQDGKEESDGFLKYMKIHWSTKVSTQSNYLLSTRHFENRRKLPHPNDIEVVATKLTEKLTNFDYKDNTQYVEVAKVALLRLMVYNRRRSGEIEELKMEKYLNRSREVDDVEQSMLGELTTTEKYLMKTQELLWIRGKRGKRVPVLIPNDTSQALNYITDKEVRKIGGVKTANQYMFASKGDGIIRASECIKQLGNENASELVHPDRLTSTGYRAYMATIAQCLGLKDHQIQWLCTHLGHTIDVHQSHYRFALDGIERIQLGKLLLLQDRNLLSKYKDTELKDIEFEDIVSSAESTGAVGEKETGPSEVQDGPSGVYEDQAALQLDVFETDDIVTVENSFMGQSSQKKKSAGVRTRWTDEETAELLKYANKYLQIRKTPSRIVCRKYIELSKKAGGELHKREADTIVKKISAMNVKARKTDPQ